MSARHFTGRGRATAAVSVLAAVAVVAAVIAFALAGNAGHGTLADDKPLVPASGTATAGDSASPPSPAHSTTAHHPASPARVTAKPAKTVPSSSTPSASPTRASPSATSRSPAPSRSPSPSPAKTSPPPSPGTLEVSPPGGLLAVPSGGATITLTAQGGPVNWSITVSGGSRGVDVRPSAGTLKQGASVSVTIQAQQLVLGTQLTVSPGGTQFTLISA